MCPEAEDILEESGPSLEQALLPSNRYLACCLCFAANSVAVTMETYEMSEIQSTPDCFILLIQESWNVKHEEKIT